jgi:hypothetical protein
MNYAARRVVELQARAKPEAAYDYAELFSALAREPAAGTPGARSGPAGDQ